MLQTFPAAVHCINPDCPKPYPQSWGNNFCQSCGASLRLQNRYIPLQRLGVGGFAAIYTVWDLTTQMERVLKVLLESSPKALELFEQEAKVLAKLQHPGIPRVEPDGYFQLELRSHAPGQAYDSVRRLPCLVMEKIHGKTLQDILDDHPQGCPEAWVFSWLAQTVEILQELHGRQIIHRDIKPSNLMLRQPSHPNGVWTQLVMIDFGGAKQVESGERSRRLSHSSTRLISPGYSPPEQIAGSAVGPAADFYALGRTCIHLLTGKYPAELEDPVTGELRWRYGASVTPSFATLLDDLVRSDARQRPSSAADLQSRLSQIALRSQRGWMTQTGETLLSASWEVLVYAAEGLRNLTFALFGAIAQIVVASLDTGWEMMLGGIGGGAGTVGGLILAYWSPLGERTASLLNYGLQQLIPEIAFQVGPEVLMFGFAGLGTAIGLTDAGGFRQRRHYWLAGSMGVLGYLFAGICWRAAIAQDAAEGMLLGALTIASLTLGMGLRSHHLIHVSAVAVGTAAVLATFNTFHLFPDTFFQVLWLSGTHPNWVQFWGSIAFFSILGSAIGFCLGVSHYLIVPLLRWLGWR